MDEKTQKLMFSKKGDEYETPLSVFSPLDDAFHFTTDPAASYLSHMLDNYLTIEDNGLARPWDGEMMFINPPYSGLKQWVKKAAESYLDVESQSVMLIPARTETIAWHSYVWPIARAIYFFRGRLKFANRITDVDNTAPFPSAVVFYVKHHPKTIEIAANGLDVLNKKGRLVWL